MKIIHLALVLDSSEYSQSVGQWAGSNHFVIKGQNPYYIDIAGTLDIISQAFQVDLTMRQDGAWYPHTDPVKPTGVHAVVGIDARPTGHRSGPHQISTDKKGFYPDDIRAAYNIPDSFTGEGETIGILQFNSGFNQNSLDVFTMETGLQVPNNPAIVSVDGQQNTSGSAPKDREATLDIEWAYAIAPKAKMAIYEAPNGTSSRTFSLHMLHALYAAMTDTNNQPSILSISYGVSESSVPDNDLLGWEALMNVAVSKGMIICISSGDTGAYGKNQPNVAKTRSVFGPASCPSALSIGGTTLAMNQGDVESETAWTNTNDNGATGGGVSSIFPMPSYQQEAGIQGQSRGVPDVAANADPNSGYFITFDGNPGTVGGTSAATPVWAGILAGINQQRENADLPALDHIHEKLYALGGKGFRDIVSGNNSSQGIGGYHAGPGWDYCTGWGVPDVAKLAENLNAN
ncbi:S53 family peptidase [Barrientosiimonas marina]|uniref:S53 family peptidase n=1 Tax=Lentibacillus kimchii TaxID=1542911 RepID=A0ABW2UU22_9BACI